MDRVGFGGRILREKGERERERAVAGESGSGESREGVVSWGWTGLSII